MSETNKTERSVRTIIEHLRFLSENKNVKDSIYGEVFADAANYLEEAGGKIESLEELVRQRGNTIAKLHCTITSRKNCVDDLMKQVDELQAELDKARETVNVQNGHLASLRAENDKLHIMLSNRTKTILDDFREKYPNATTGANGYPVPCPKQLGYVIGDCGSVDSCIECWHQPLKTK